MAIRCHQTLEDTEGVVPTLSGYWGGRDRMQGHYGYFTQRSSRRL